MAYLLSAMIEKRKREWIARLDRLARVLAG